MADAQINWNVLNPPERKRTYSFRGEPDLIIENVSRIEIRESGTHRIETADGKKYFVRPTWDFLKIDVDAWTA